MKQLTNICKKQKCACWWWSLVASCKCLLLPHSARAQITLLHIVWIWWSHLCELLMCMYISAGILCKFFTFFLLWHVDGFMKKSFCCPRNAAINWNPEQKTLATQRQRSRKVPCFQCVCTCAHVCVWRLHVCGDYGFWDECHSSLKQAVVMAALLLWLNMQARVWVCVCVRHHGHKDLLAHLKWLTHFWHTQRY